MQKCNKAVMTLLIVVFIFSTISLLLPTHPMMGSSGSFSKPISFTSLPLMQTSVHPPTSPSPPHSGLKPQPTTCPSKAPPESRSWGFHHYCQYPSVFIELYLTKSLVYLDTENIT